MIGSVENWDGMKPGVSDDRNVLAIWIEYHGMAHNRIPHRILPGVEGAKHPRETVALAPEGH